MKVKNTNEARGTLSRLIEHYSNSRYREVFLLTAAQLPDASMFFEQFLAYLTKEVKQRPAVAGLLRSADSRALNGAKAGITRTTARSMFIFFNIDLDLIVNLASDLVHDITFEMVNDQALANDLGLISTWTSNEARTKELAFAREQALIRAYARTRPINFVIDIARALEYSENHYLAYRHFAASHSARELTILNDSDLSLTLAIGLANNLAFEMGNQLNLSRGNDLMVQRGKHDSQLNERANEIESKLHNRLMRDTLMTYCWLCAEAAVSIRDKDGQTVWINTIKTFASKAAELSKMIGDVETPRQLAPIIEKLITLESK